MPPDNDTTISYYDRQEGTPVEARAGLTLYREKGWVGADQHSEAGSRTLDYACERFGFAENAENETQVRLIASRALTPSVREGKLA